MENEIKYRDIVDEIDCAVKDAIEETLEHETCSDLDELREKVSDRLHETIDGHEWVIYYSKSADLVYRLRQSDHTWYQRAQDECRDLGGMEIGENEDLDNVNCRLAYSILMVGCNDHYESILESYIQDDCNRHREAGKDWAQGFKDNNSTREEAYAAEETGRQYSPFEFIAHEINSLPWADEAWEAFQDGIDSVLGTMLGEEDVDYWLCPDCLQAAVNNDYTGLDYYYGEPEATERMETIKNGLDRLGNIANTGHVLTFSRHGCDCCGSDLAGELHGFCEIKVRADK